MDTISGYKNRALANLTGNWGKAAIATLIYVMIAGALPVAGPFIMGSESTAVSMLSNLWSLACIPLAWGYSVLFLDFVRGNGLVSERMFDGYKDFARIFIANLLVTLVLIVGFILLIVPGVIAWLMLSQTNFILKDNKEIGAVDALQKSANMMKGHKMDYFLLALSFIGWAILCVLTLGIGVLFLEPYMQTSFAHFYEDLRAEQGE